jgi:integrase
VRTPTREVNRQTGEVYYRVRYRKDGKQRALTFYGDTEKAALTDAEEFAALLASLGAERAVKWWNEHLDADPGDRGMTLDDWWPLYLESLTGITKGTRDSYRGTYKRVWAPTLGPMPLTSITRTDVARVINRLSDEGKSDKTVKNVYGVLTSCLKYALLDGHLPAVPTRGIRLPRATEHTRTEMIFLSYPEWVRLRDALPAHYRPVFTFLVGTGCRWGEVEAVTVGDVNLDRVYTHPDGSIESTPSVTINKAAKWNATSSRRETGPTKTLRSNRTIYIPPDVVEAVEPLLGRPPGDRLFVAPRGGQLNHRTVYDVWKTARKKAGLNPKLRIHDLRHTHVSWLIGQGVDMVVIQHRLGHEQITTTADRYGHLSLETELSGARAAAVAMRPAVRELEAPTR